MRLKLNEIPTQPVEVHNAHCSANGCPMAGTIGSHTVHTPTSQYWCAIHSSVDAKFTQVVTREIRENYSMIQAAYEMMRVPMSSKEASIVEQFGKKMVDLGYPEFAPRNELETKSARLLGYRIVKDITNKITTNRLREAEEGGAESSDNLRTIDGLLAGIKRR